MHVSWGDSVLIVGKGLSEIIGRRSHDRNTCVNIRGWVPTFPLLPIQRWASVYLLKEFTLSDRNSRSPT